MVSITTCLYERFQCVAEACLDTCCGKGWDIIVDKATYAKYKEVDLNKGTNICKNIEERDGEYYFVLKEGICPFLNNCKLCNIILNVSPEYLSYTCETYPRKIKKLADITSATVMLSCPEVARVMLNKNEQIEFSIVDNMCDNKNKDDVKYQLISDGLIASICVLQDKNVPFRNRVYAALALNRFIEEGKMSDDASSLLEMDTIINEYVDNWVYDQAILNGVDDSVYKNGMWEFIYDLLKKAEGLQGLTKGCTELLHSINLVSRNDGEDYSHFIKKYKDNETVFRENVFVNFVFSLYLETYQSYDVYELILKGILLLACLDAFAYIYMRKNDSCTQEERCITISRVAALFDNSNAFDELLKIVINANETDKMDKLVYFV